MTLNIQDRQNMILNGRAGVYFHVYRNTGNGNIHAGTGF